MAQDQRPGHEDEEPQKIERHDLEEQDDDLGGVDPDNSPRIDFDRDIPSNSPGINFDRDIPGGQSD